MIGSVTQRRVARALRAGGPEVIEVCVEELAPLKAGEVLVRVEAAGLNHAETLIRSGNYTVRLPFPHAVGAEGSVNRRGDRIRGDDVCGHPGVLGSGSRIVRDFCHSPSFHVTAHS
jgi:NADPH2:quinone reductase